MPTQPGQAAIWLLTPVPQRQATCQGPEQSRHLGGAGVPEQQMTHRRAEAIAACQRHRRPEMADGTPAGRGDCGVSATQDGRDILPAWPGTFVFAEMGGSFWLSPKRMTK